MHLFKTIRQVCDAEYRSALKASSPAEPRKVGLSLPAPVRPAQRVSTRNRREWTEVALFLKGRPVNARGAA